MKEELKELRQAIVFIISSNLTPYTKEWAEVTLNYVNYMNFNLMSQTNSSQTEELKVMKEEPKQLRQAIIFINPWCPCGLQVYNKLLHLQTHTPHHEEEHQQSQVSRGKESPEPEEGSGHNAWSYWSFAENCLLNTAFSNMCDTGSSS